MTSLDELVLASVCGGQTPVIKDFSIKHEMCFGVWDKNRDHAWGNDAYSAHMTGCMLRNPSQGYREWEDGMQPPLRLAK